MYVRISPTDDSPPSSTLTDQHRRLHGVTTGDNPWWKLPFRDPTPVEWLLVTPDSHEPTIEYYAGILDEEGDNVRQLFRSLFPNTYELEVVERPSVFGSTDDQQATDPAAAVEFEGRAARRQDWQMPLASVDVYDEAHARVPLAAVVEAMAALERPAVYQALLRPYPDWTATRNGRVQAIRDYQDTVIDQIVNVIGGTPDPDTPLSAGDEQRIEALEQRDTRESFVLNARFVVGSHDENSQSGAERAARFVASAFDEVGRSNHRVAATVHTGSSAARIQEAVAKRTVHGPSYERLWTRLPATANTSRGIVADSTEAPLFGVVDGSALTTAGERALSTTPEERTAVPRPPDALLDTYQGEGLAVGTPLTQDGTAGDTAVAVPPALQPLHCLWLGKTGSGKSTALLNAILANQAATDGLDVLVDRKGDGMPREYLRAHYLEHGSLEAVYYFECSETLPALSFFDIRDQIEAGIDRASAVEDVVEHYVEILKGVMGADSYERALRSPDIIRYLVKAMFDPVHGADAFAHRDLEAAVHRMADTRDAPAVSDTQLERLLGGIAANSKRSFDELMQGVANRIEKVPMHDRLGTIFNHVPTDEDDPHLDLQALLSEDAVLVLDLGDLRPEIQRVLTLLLLSKLWTALRRRTTTDSGPTPDGAELPLVNLYLEEAADVAHSGLVKDLLSQSRSFGLSVTLAMQFPGQLEERDREAYAELMNNVSTVVTGNVGVDRDLARRLATGDMDPADVGNRLRSLSRGEWLTKLPAPFDQPEPRPFLLESLPLPPGHPDGSHPLDDDEQQLLAAAITRIKARTRDQTGLEITSGTTGPLDEDTAAPAVQGSDTDESDDSTADDDHPVQPMADAPHIATTLPFTKRLPDPVDYDAAADAVRCDTCDTLNPPSLTGTKRAINCCRSMDHVARENVPAHEVGLMLDADARRDADYTTRQLVFLQVVLNAGRLEYDRELEYDIFSDSMVRLREYVGIENDAIQELIDDGVLRHDCDHPHRLYSLTSAGREIIDQPAQEGIDYGHGVGDLDESTQHVLGVQLGTRLLEAAYVENDTSDVEEVVPYFELEDGHRLDIAGLDDEGDIIVTVEVERINHDTREAVPRDYDKMASCDPAEAIWIVTTQSVGHQVLEALNDPLEGDVRVEKTYSSTTPPHQLRIDTPGCSGFYSISYLLNRLDQLDTIVD